MEFSFNNRTVFIGTDNQQLDASRETVVFIHGAGQNHSIWVLPTRYFARKKFNVLSVDLPGHGKSAGPCLSTIEEMSDWMVGLLDALGLQKFAIVGHSMGSLVALAVAAEHAERTRSLAMVGTSVPMPVSDALLESAKANDHAALEMLTYWGHSTPAHFGNNPNPGMWTLGGGMRLLEQADDGVVYADLNACSQYQVGIEHAAAVQCPAMLILGESDMMTPVRATKDLAAALSNVETVVLPQAGHALLSERPNCVLDALIRIV